MTDRYMLPTANTLPHYGKVRLRTKGPWVPCVLLMEQPQDSDGQPLGDAVYCAWVGPEGWTLPDPDIVPHWPWEPIDRAEYAALRKEMGF